MTTQQWDKLAAVGIAFGHFDYYAASRYPSVTTGVMIHGCLTLPTDATDITFVAGLDSAELMGRWMARQTLVSEGKDVFLKTSSRQVADGFRLALSRTDGSAGGVVAPTPGTELDDFANGCMSPLCQFSSRQVLAKRLQDWSPEFEDLDDSDVILPSGNGQTEWTVGDINTKFAGKTFGVLQGMVSEGPAWDAVGVTYTTDGGGAYNSVIFNPAGTAQVIVHAGAPAEVTAALGTFTGRKLRAQTDLFKVREAMVALGLSSLTDKLLELKPGDDGTTATAPWLKPCMYDATATDQARAFTLFKPRESKDLIRLLTTFRDLERVMIKADGLTLDAAPVVP